MNGSVSRRVFVGSLAGAGVGAVGATSLLEFPVAAQPAATAPLVSEVHRQLKQAFAQMRDGRSEGARQAATVLRLYASTLNDGQLQSSLRKADRRQLLLADGNHGELERTATELGIDPSMLPPHSVDRVGREVALDRLITEGLSPLMLHVADYVDEVGDKMRRLELSGKARPLQIALRQPVPSSSECGDCAREKEQLDAAMQTATIVCAAALAVPLLAELCVAASLAFVTFQGAYSICLAIVAFCQAYSI